MDPCHRGYTDSTLRRLAGHRPHLHPGFTIAGEVGDGKPFLCCVVSKQWTEPPMKTLNVYLGFESSVLFLLFSKTAVLMPHKVILAHEIRC